MELKNLVAHYATKGEKGVEINLEALSQDKHFRSQAVQAVVKKVKEKHLDGPDLLFITSINLNTTSGWLPSTSVEWLRDLNR